MSTKSQCLWSISLPFQKLHLQHSLIEHTSCQESHHQYLLDYSGTLKKIRLELDHKYSVSIFALDFIFLSPQVQHNLFKHYALLFKRVFSTAYLNIMLCYIKRKKEFIKRLKNAVLCVRQLID